MSIAIVRYNAGNIQSVTYALNRLGVVPVVTDDPEKLRTADKVIFPGVGEAASAMNYLRSKSLDKVITSLKQPVLGICLGLQLLCNHSEERDTTCLGVFDVAVKKFRKPDKVPQIGWNKLENMKGSLIQGLEGDVYTYFVHSFYAEPGVYTTAVATYGETFSAMLQKDNFYAIQSHPEKSGKTGAKILENFLAL